MIPCVGGFLQNKQLTASVMSSKEMNDQMAVNVLLLYKPRLMLLLLNI